MNHLRQKAFIQKEIVISCIIPVFNEEAGIKRFLESLVSLLEQLTHHYEIVIVDDGSTDRTLEVIDQFSPNQHIKIISFTRNFGKEIALTAGLDFSKGDVSIIIDADFQHPLDLIPKFLENWVAGYDMVYGRRIDRASETFFKKSFAQLFYWLMKKITTVEIPKNAGDFRLLDKEVVKALKAFPERTRFMKGLYAWVGYKQKAIPFEVQLRQTGKSSWGFFKLLELAITGITSFSDVPLRVWGYVGFLISFIALIYAFYILNVTLFYGTDLPGFPTIVVAVMFLGGIQLLSVGILGEYIARIFTEVKQRPKYIINLKKGFSD